MSGCPKTQIYNANELGYKEGYMTETEMRIWILHN